MLSEMCRIPFKKKKKKLNDPNRVHNSGVNYLGKVLERIVEE